MTTLTLPSVSTDVYEEAAELSRERENLLQQVAQTEQKLREVTSKMFASQAPATTQPRVTKASVHRTNGIIKRPIATKSIKAKNKGTAPRDFQRGQLSEEALALITKAGKTGISPTDLAKELHCDVKRNILPWYYGTGNKLGVTRWELPEGHRGNFVLASFI